MVVSLVSRASFASYSLLTRIANTQTGSGHGDGIYYHNSQGPAVKAEIESPWDRKQWRFARLFNPLYDDLLGWYEYATNDHRFGVWYVEPL